MDDISRTDNDSAIAVLETIRTLWVKVGAWPLWGDVDFMIDSRLGIAEPWRAVREIDRRLLWGVGDQEPSDRSEVGLSVAGLALLPNAAEDLRIFIDTVQAAATFVRERPPSEDGDRLLSTDLARVVTLPAAGRESIVRRQLSIWRTTAGWSSLGGPDPETGVWSLTIDRKAIRRYREVSTVEDFLRAEPAISTLSAGLSALIVGQPGSAPDATQPVTPAETSTKTPPTGASAPVDWTVTAPDVGYRGATLAGTAEAPVPRTEVVTTSNCARFVLFLDHIIAQTNGTIVYAGQRLESGDGLDLGPSDTEREPVAIKRVSLRTFDTEAWYRDGRAIEREALAAEVFADVTESHVLPLLGNVLNSASFTFVYPLAVTTLDHVVAVAAAAKGITGPRPFGEPTAGRSPVQHDPARAARELYGTRGPDEDTVRAVGLELARGLAAMHNRAVLHRDIKPANILRQDGRWRIADLGIARLMEDTTTTFTLAGVGTREYMPPEIFALRPATVRSDVYSLGCTLYAVLYGRPPWTDGDLSRSHRLEAVDVSAVADDALAVALAAMMQKEEAARPTAEQVAIMLEARATPMLASLSTVVRAAARVNEDRAIGRAKAEGRQAAADIAIARFQLVWRQLEAMVHGSYPSVMFSDGQDAWLMTIGDWQLTVQIHEPSSSLCPAVQLGTVSMQIADRPEQRTAMANLVALWTDGKDVPDWRIYQMASDYLAVDKVPVSQSRAAGTGAISHQHLEEHLAQQGSAGAIPAMVTSDLELTAMALLDLYTAEVALILERNGPDR